MPHVRRADLETACRSACWPSRSRGSPHPIRNASGAEWPRDEPIYPQHLVFSNPVRQATPRGRRSSRSPITEPGPRYLTIEYFNEARNPSRSGCLSPIPTDTDPDLWAQGYIVGERTTSNLAADGFTERPGWRSLIFHRTPRKEGRERMVTRVMGFRTTL